MSNSPHEYRELRRFAEDPDVIELPEPIEKQDGGPDEQSEAPNPNEDSDRVPSREELEAAAGDLLETDDILKEVDRSLQGRYAGPTDVVKLVALSLYTRHSNSPVSVVLRGESSAGKSYAIKQALGFAAPEAHYVLTASSPKALIYSDEDLRHRTLVIYEGEGIASDFASYLVRSLLSEGRIAYEVTDFENKGTVKITKEGPTGLVLSTAGRIDYELSTRMISASVDDSPEITGEILKVEALGAVSAVVPPDLSRFHALDRLLGLEPRTVVIPYALTLAELTDRRAVRMRRDFGALLGLIKAHALLHHRHRDTNAAGEIVAAIADYRAVHDLVSRLLADASGRSIPDAVRKVAEVVEMLHLEDQSGAATIQAVADRMERDRTTASRYLKRAVGMGFVNETTSQWSNRKAFQPGEPLPNDAGVLPDPEEIAAQ